MLPHGRVPLRRGDTECQNSLTRPGIKRQTAQCMGGNRLRSHPPPSETFHLIALLHALGWDLGALHDEDVQPTVTLHHLHKHQIGTQQERQPRIHPQDQILLAGLTPAAKANWQIIHQDFTSSWLPSEPSLEHPPQSRRHQKCDVASPKASLSQGREGKWEWKGTPELTDAYLLTGGSGGKRDERVNDKTRWGTEGSPSASLYNQRYNYTLKWHVPTGGRMPTMKKC
jgi:hypothetical protein